MWAPRMWFSYLPNLLVGSLRTRVQRTVGACVMSDYWL